MSEAKLQVKIFSPYEVFYEGGAVSLSAQNKTGPFDILYNHSNFFSLLTAGIVRVKTDYGDLIEIQILRGVIRVTQNSVTLFANV